MGGCFEETTAGEDASLSPLDYRSAAPDPNALEDALIELLDSKPTLRWALAKIVDRPPEKTP